MKISKQLNKITKKNWHKMQFIYTVFFSLQIDFEDVIAEPGGAYSPECVWRNSHWLFDCGRNCCYACLSITCALPCAFCSGCSFACLYFQQVWCAAPALRHCRIHCTSVKKFLTACLESICGPCCSTMGLCLSQIKISRYQLTGSEVV